MVLSKEDKKLQIQIIEEKITKSSSIIVWNYFNNNANFVSNIKKIIRENNGEDIVYRNRIAKIAFERTNRPEIIEYLKGSSSFLFIYDDEQKSLKELNKILKESKKDNFLKAGYVGETFYDGQGIKEIAELPSRNELISMLISAMQAKIRDFAYVISKIKSEEEK